MVFDKTGTLTIGKFEVSKVISLQNGLSENELIRIASALEQNSEHPIATGILQKVKDLKIQVPATENFNAITGKGVEATVEGKKIKVVSPGFLKENNIPLPENFKTDAAETVVFVIIDNALADTLLCQMKYALNLWKQFSELKKNHIKSILLTGDNKKLPKQ